jgi:hypothetical protein
MAMAGDLPNGASSYFSAPSHGLDPHLFEAEHLMLDVRSWVLSCIWDFLTREVHLTKPHEWLNVWLAGSGVTYQWEAARGNGDLDVLIGIDMKKFRTSNPELAYVPEDSVAQWLNTELREELWPKTAHQDINGQIYEVTFYWNPGVGNDISVIHPYAAYDVLEDKWKVRPPTLPNDPSSLYPTDWQGAANDDLQRAQSIYTGYNQNGNSPRYAALAKDLFESIHGGRKAAFADGGKGYGDFANYRWQSAKQHGVIAALSDIVRTSEAGGQQLDPADIILTRAMMRYNSTRYDR